MRRRILTILLIVAILTQGFTSYADDEPQLIKKRATAYCLTGTTAMGTQTRYGVCASGDKSLLGKTVICYKRLPNDGIGEIIGIYQVEDTGCSEYVIDIWMPNLEECQEVMNKVYEDGCKGKIWIQVFECKG